MRSPKYLVHFVVVVAILFVINLFTGSIVYEDGYRVIEQKETRTTLTRRKRNVVVLEQAGEAYDFSGWLVLPIHRTFSVEFPSGEEFEIGTTFTYQELDTLRGKSNLGAVWDWLKQPRKVK